MVTINMVMAKAMVIDTMAQDNARGDTATTLERDSTLLQAQGTIINGGLVKKDGELGTNAGETTRERDTKGDKGGTIHGTNLQETQGICRSAPEQTGEQQVANHGCRKEMVQTIEGQSSTLSTQILGTVATSSEENLGAG